MSIIKERVTCQYPIVAIEHVFGTIDIMYSDPIDTSGYEDGVYFAMSGVFPAASVTTLIFQHSHTTTPGDFVELQPSNVVYGRNLSSLSNQYYVHNNSVSTKGFEGLTPIREGVRNTRRYVRVGVDPNGATGAYVNVLAVLDAELSPTPRFVTYTFPPPA